MRKHRAWFELNILPDYTKCNDLQSHTKTTKSRGNQPARALTGGWSEGLAIATTATTVTAVTTVTTAAAMPTRSVQSSTRVNSTPHSELWSCWSCGCLGLLLYSAVPPLDAPLFFCPNHCCCCSCSCPLVHSSLLPLRSCRRFGISLVFGPFEATFYLSKKKTGARIVSPNTTLLPLITCFHFRSCKGKLPDVSEKEGRKNNLLPHSKEKFRFNLTLKHFLDLNLRVSATFLYLPSGNRFQLHLGDTTPMYLM